MNKRLLQTFFTFLLHLNANIYYELINYEVNNKFLFHQFISLLQYSNTNDQQLIIHIILELQQLHILLDLIKKLNLISLDMTNLSNPKLIENIQLILQKAKQCLLCRNKSKEQFQFHMLQNDIPKNIIKVPGALKIYDKSEIWISSNENEYHIEQSTGINSITKMYWKDYEIDMIQICSLCLEDIHHYLISTKTNNTLIESIYMKDPKERKAILHQRQSHAILHANVFIDYTMYHNYRRLYELLQQCLINMKEEILYYKHINIKQNEIQLHKQLEDDLLEKHTSLVSKAMSYNKQYILKEKRDTLTKLQNTETYVELLYHPDFNESNSMILRRHPLSWELLSENDKGVPLTRNAVSRVSY